MKLLSQIHHLRLFWRILIASCACLWASLGFAADFAGPQASSLERLDQIAEKAGSLNGFLTNTPVQDEYFHVLAQYYGESRITRESFDEILKQIKILVKKVPVAGERLWNRRTPGEPLVIDTLEAPEGAKLSVSGWRKFRTQWIHELEESSSSIRTLPTDEARHAEVNRLFGLLGQRIDSFNQELESSGSSKRVQKERSREFYLGIQSDPDFRKATSYLALERAQQGPISEYLSSSDASQVLYGLETLQSADAPRGIQIPESLRSLIKFGTPSPESILGNSEVFHFPEGSPSVRSGRALKAQRWVFREPARLLHTAWQGIPFKECVGGYCDLLQETTARRWAVPLLTGARDQFLERGDRFQGFIQSVESYRGGNLYTSLEVMAPDMQKVALVSREGQSTLVPMSLFDAWYGDAVKHLPKHSKGFIIGSSEGFANGLGYSSIYSSPAYLHGSDLGPAGNLTPTDAAFEQKVVGASPGGIVAKRYGGTDRMIFETRDLGANHLTLLGAPMASANAPSDPLRSVEAARALIKGSVDGEIRLFSALAYQPWTLEMLAMLREERAVLIQGFQDTKSPARAAAIRFVKEATPSAFHAFFRIGLVGSLNVKQYELEATYAKFIKSVRESLHRDPETVSRGIERAFHGSLVEFLRSTPSFEQVLKVRAPLAEANSIDVELTYMKTALERISTPADFTAVFDLNRTGRVWSVYLQEYAQLLHESLPKFLKMYPNAADIDDFLKHRGPYIDLADRESVVSAGLVQARSEERFIRLVSFSDKSALSPGFSPGLSKDELALRDKLIQDHLDDFFRLRPHSHQIEKLLNLCSTPHERVALARKALNFMTTPYEYVDFMSLGVDSPSEEYRKEMENVFRESLQHVDQLKLPPWALMRVKRELSMSVQTSIQAMERGLSQVQSVDDFFTLIELRESESSPEMIQAREKFVRDHVDRFRLLKPKLEERLKLNDLVPGVLRLEEIRMLGRFSPSCIIQKLRAL